MVDTELLNMGETRAVAEVDECVLDEISLPVGSKITSYTSRFESKITFGDYSKDSDQLQSTWIQSMWSGGMLINKHLEGATDQRGRWANAWTMSSEQLALPPKVVRHAHSPSIISTDTKAHGAISTPLIEIDDMLYVCYANRIWTYQTSDESIATLAGTSRLDLPAYAQGHAVYVGGMDRIMIPLGYDGIAIYRTHLHGTPHTLEVHTPGVRAMSLVAWDNRIIAGTTDGYVRVFHTGTSTWDAPSPSLKVEADETIRHVTRFYDQAGNEAVYIVTDKRMWAYDAEVEKIYPSNLTWPKHAQNGHGATVWRDDAVYISTGYSVTRYTRDGVRTDMGMDRDDGIPADKVKGNWSGFRRNMGRSITSMVGTQNFIVAAVQLGEVSVAETDGVNASYPYAICVWNEAGWHVLHEGVALTPGEARAGVFPDNLMVTETVGGYRVWWGFTTQKRFTGGYAANYVGNAPMETMRIPRSFHSPRQSILDTIDEFATTGYYDTGWFDAGMRGFDKTWSHLEVTLPPPGDGQALNGTVEVLYRTDTDPETWVPFGAVNDYGTTILKFNEDGEGVPRGSTTRAIELRFLLSTSIATRSPIIESFVLKFIKLPLPGRAWQLSVPLDAGEWNGMGAHEIEAELKRRTYEGGFSVFIDNDKKFRVRVSQVQAIGGTGNLAPMQIQINLIEVPIAGDLVWGGDS